MKLVKRAVGMAILGAVIMGMMFLLISGTKLLVAMAFVGVSFWLVPAMMSYFEAKRWNHGICGDCGLPWQHRDTDSQGGRMYVCGCGQHHTIWLSWLSEPIEAPIAE